MAAGDRSLSTILLLSDSSILISLALRDESCLEARSISSALASSAQDHILTTAGFGFQRATATSEPPLRAGIKWPDDSKQ